jgi:hypothetical protein
VWDVPQAPPGRHFDLTLLDATRANILRVEAVQWAQLASIAVALGFHLPHNAGATLNQIAQAVGVPDPGWESDVAQAVAIINAYHALALAGVNVISTGPPLAPDAPVNVIQSRQIADLMATAQAAGLIVIGTPGAAGEPGLEGP